jgi:MinD-like ATPase involved in chromosome partitioning or flagellar assembly
MQCNQSLSFAEREHMSKIISVHSYRGGTGKSNTSANLTALLAAQGLRVGVIDTDIPSPGIHVLFGLDEEKMGLCLNDYLWGKCEIKDTALDVTPSLRALDSSINGQVYLVSSSIRAGEIARILREGYDVGLLNDGFQRLLSDLDLDVLMIDTHPGLNEETLLSIAISDALTIILRPDRQDFQGTSVTVEVARKLDVPMMMLLVNKAPQSLNFSEVKAQVERTYNCEVGAVLPHSDEMMMLASEGIFVLRYPDHPITKSLQQVAKRLME